MGHQTHLLIMRMSESEPRAQASGADGQRPTPARTPHWRAAVL